jgi:hypothetical protein
MLREFVSGARLVPGQVLDHLRDDVAGTLDPNAVSDAKAAVVKYAGPQTTWAGPTAAGRIRP